MKAQQYRTNATVRIDDACYLTRCAGCLGHQLSEVERRLSLMAIEPDAQGMHQHVAQHAVGQVPAVARPDPLDGTAVNQLPEDGVDAITKAAEQPAPAWMRVALGRAVGCDQVNPIPRQLSTQPWRPVVAVAQ